MWPSYGQGTLWCFPVIPRARPLTKPPTSFYLAAVLDLTHAFGIGDLEMSSSGLLTIEQPEGDSRQSLQS